MIHDTITFRSGGGKGPWLVTALLYVDPTASGGYSAELDTMEIVGHGGHDPKRLMFDIEELEAEAVDLWHARETADA